MRHTLPVQAAACPGPDPRPHGPTRFTVPAGAVDTHAHVIGLPPTYPFTEQRSYTPPAAPASAYIEMLDRSGMAHGVLVQVSVHGSDNSLLLATLAQHRQRLRGIAVMPLGLPVAEYEKARAAGVVGLRLNVLYGGGIGFDTLAEYGALAQSMGWHLQFLVDARQLPALASTIATLPVPYVVDHMGHFPAALGVQSEGFETLLSLVKDGGWVKLSGAYRLSGQGLPYADTNDYARLLAEAAPERCVWGSDWPHVAHWNQPMMNVGDLLDTLHHWVPDAALRQRILVENAQRLYGFGSSA